jgi:outer membrane protein assembly factor BamD
MVRRWPMSATLGALALSLAVLGGCGLKTASSAPATLTYTENANAAYREAMAAYDSKDWEDARALFTEVKQRFAPTRYARLAELRIADTDFEQGKYNEAIAEYRTYVKAHRGDPNVEYASYRVGKALYLDISDTILLPPQEERDQADTLDAHRALHGFKEEYPRSRYRIDVEYMLEVVTQRLVRHELYVARYYLRENNFEAVVARVDHALDKYPGSGLDAEALVLKGETLMKMHKPKEARQVLETVVRDHGGPFGLVAKRFLAVLDEPPS